MDSARKSHGSIPVALIGRKRRYEPGGGAPELPRKSIQKIRDFYPEMKEKPKPTKRQFFSYPYFIIAQDL